MTFPITLWPGAFAVPKARRVSVEVLAGKHQGWLAVHSSDHRQPVPDEFYVRELLDLDTTDAGEVVAFIEQYGRAAADAWTLTTPRSGRHTVIPGGALPEWTMAKRPRFGIVVSDDGKQTRPLAVHIDDITWSLRLSQAVSLSVIAWREETSLVDAWTSLGFVIEEQEQAAECFSRVLNHRLEPFRAHVRVGDHHPGVILRENVDEAASVQVFNHIANDEPVRRCENDRCGRAFVRQLGGARHGQHRMSGLLRYCTPNCARAVAQREYRRRQKKS